MQKQRIATLAALVAAAAMSLGGLVGCGAPKANDAGDSGSGAASSTLQIGWNQPLFSVNQFSSNGHATANGNVTYLTRAKWAYYDGNLKYVDNTKFGTMKLDSEQPLTVTQTIAKDATWSDGVPVTAADELLDWAARSGALNTVKSEDVERDDEGDAEVASDQVFFDAGDPQVALIKDTPTMSQDSKSITFVYSQPTSDWMYNFYEIGVPAHVVAKVALGIDDPDQATAALVKAIQDDDKAQLAKIAAVWNTGFDFTSMPTNKDLVVSSGPYVISSYVEGQYLTLTKNPKYTWGEPASVDQLIIRFNEDPMASVQALKNGEMDIIQPQVTPDVKSALTAAPGIATKEAYEGTYEHIDLTFANKGPFDPASYGGDAQKALTVREAFLKALPRQEIVDKLIKPLQKDATTRDSFNVVPGAPGYEQTVEANGSAAFATADPAGALALLKQAGIKTPVKVRLLYGKSNARRAQEYQLIYEAEKPAGFDVVDVGNDNWGSMLGTSRSKYDAALFGWQSTSTAASEPAANYMTGGQNNFSAYKNPNVDQLYDQLRTTTDPAAQQQINSEVEKDLFADGYGVPLYQFPGILAWNSAKVRGVSTITLSPTLFWNYWQWKVV